MLDIQNSLAHPLVIRREDYTPPEWLVPETKLAFDLDPSTTRVTATLSVQRNGDHAAPLRLDGGVRFPAYGEEQGPAAGAGGAGGRGGSGGLRERYPSVAT